MNHKICERCGFLFVPTDDCPFGSSCRKIVGWNNLALGPSETPTVRIDRNSIPLISLGHPPIFNMLGSKVTLQEAKWFCDTLGVSNRDGGGVVANLKADCSDEKFGILATLKTQQDEIEIFNELRKNYQNRKLGEYAEAVTYRIITRTKRCQNTLLAHIEENKLRGAKIMAVQVPLKNSLKPYSLTCQTSPLPDEKDDKRIFKVLFYTKLQSLYFVLLRHLEKAGLLTNPDVKKYQLQIEKSFLDLEQGKAVDILAIDVPAVLDQNGLFITLTGNKNLILQVEK
jgi:hypothetical protein